MSDTMLPDPLVPAEVDLSDFKFMPLDCVRLRDSDLASKVTGDEFRCAVLLWCASWHQLPAASLPDDDEVLAKLAGFGRVVREWRKVKPGAMRGWVSCSDGRLYHPVVAEKALESWRSKLEQRWRTECGRIKKHNQRHSMSLPLIEFDQWMSQGCPQGHALPVPEDTGGVSQGQTPHVPRETASKRSKGKGREGKGLEEEKKTSSSSSAVPTIPCPYDRIVDLYHERLPGLPRVKLMPKTRQAALRKLWGWVLSSSKSDGARRATTAEQALEWIGGYFARAADNDFLMGRTQRSGEHANWRCDLDFLLTDRGMRHVIEKTQEHVA